MTGRLCVDYEEEQEDETEPCIRTEEKKIGGSITAKYFNKDT